jgi:hypothetical protein
MQDDAMPTNSFNEILERAREELTSDERLKLISELSQPSDKRVTRKSICQLKGLGKEVWKEIDPDEYVRKERDSWGG